MILQLEEETHWQFLAVICGKYWHQSSINHANIATTTTMQPTKFNKL